MNSAFVASALISVSLLLGRLSGFIREALLASHLGASASADAAILILTLPDFMVGLLLSGGISAALLPILKRHKGADRLYLTRRTGLIITLGFTGLALLFAIFSEAVIRIFIPLADFTALDGFSVGFNLSLVALPVAALIGVSASYLNTVGRFTIPGIGVLVFNGVICTYLLLPFADISDLIWFGAVVVFAAVLRLMFQLSFMLETMRALKGPPPPWPKRFIRKFVTGTLGFSVIVGAAIIFRSLHALNGAGQMAAFNYAQKLFELPAALLIAPVTIVLLPILSGLDHADKISFENHTRNGLLAGLTLACVATSLGWLYMPTAVRIIFEHGTMTPAESERITDIASLLIFALPLYALLQVCATALNAQGRPDIMTVSSCVGLIAGVAFYGVLNHLGWQNNAAAAGFLMFNLVAASFCTRAVFGWSIPRKATVRALILMLLKLSLISVPFLYLQIILPSMPVWYSITSMIAAGLIMTAANFPLIKPLVAMKIDKN